MALLDFTSNRKNELLVGSEDYEIRVFEDDELLMGKVYVIIVLRERILLCPSKYSRTLLIRTSLIHNLTNPKPH